MNLPCERKFTKIFVEPSAYEISICDPTGFDFKQLNTNSVIRWEYRPGSAIFLVWQQGRFRNVNRAATFDGLRDYEDLFSLHPNNTFLIKASYWFNY